MRRWLAVGVSAVLAAVTSCAVIAPLDDVKESKLSGDGGGQGCTTNAQCIAANFDSPQRCLEGRCVALRTDDCRYIWDDEATEADVKNDRALFLGAFADYGSNGEGPDFANYVLALSELSGSNSGGLPGPD